MLRGILRLKKNISLALAFSQVYWLPRYYILFKRARFVRDDLILDAGCAQGFVTLALARKGLKVVGIDKSFENIKEAQKYKETLRFKGQAYFLVADLEKLPLKQAILDKIVSLDTLEYIKEDRAALEEFRRTLKPEGKLFISLPNGYVCDGRLFIQRILRRIVPGCLLSRDLPGFRAWLKVDSSYLMNKLGDVHKFKLEDIKTRTSVFFKVIDSVYFIKLFSSLAIDMAYGIRGLHRIKFLFLFIAVRLDYFFIKRPWGYAIFLELVPRGYS